MDINLLNSENVKSFNDKRDIFKPYGLACELWIPRLMRRADQHNEIEINYFPQGTITYLIQDKKIMIPARKFAVFWGLVPHQIVHFQGDSPYFVCTIPFSQFLEWKLPDLFVDRILNGEVLIETSDIYSQFDEFFLNIWFNDLNKKYTTEISLLEIRARLLRMAESILPDKDNVLSSIRSNEISNVERIAIYIAQNYHNPLKVADIARTVHLHPDYANAIFKKAFGCTLTHYISEERISHAKRKLVATDKSITEISFECGFNSISRFNEAFRKNSKCTPREFRRKYLNQRSSIQ
jgi:AraC family transcriptional regulator, melibiose operon regulatory protein